MEDWIAREGRNLVPRDRLRALSVKSDARGALQAGSHAAAIAATTAGLAFAYPATAWAWLPVAFVQGVLINCLYAGQHELSHWTVFRTKAANDALGHLFGFATLNPFLTDRFLHFAHHRATHDRARDPELMGTGAYTPLSYFLDFSGMSFWVRRVTGIARAAAGRGLDGCWWLGPRERIIVVVEARAHIALWILIALGSALTGSGAAVYLWLGPLLATKWVHQLQNSGEHTGLPHAADIFANTRTLTGSAPWRWLMWNMSWHTAHHCFPGVPFHALPALHREIAASRPVITRGYLDAQRDIWARLLTPRRA
jgi:fatty acid desaturase